MLQSKITIIINWLRYILGTVLLVMSIWLIVSSNSAKNFQIFQQPEYVRYILGLSEAFASFMFIINRTKSIGAFGLLAVFVYATYLHLNIGLNAYGLIPWAIGVLVCLIYDSYRKYNINRLLKMNIS